jgi:hypothetical protein
VKSLCFVKPVSAARNYFFVIAKSVAYNPMLHLILFQRHSTQDMQSEAGYGKKEQSMLAVDD